MRFRIRKSISEHDILERNFVNNAAAFVDDIKAERLRVHLYTGSRQCAIENLFLTHTLFFSCEEITREDGPDFILHNIIPRSFIVFPLFHSKRLYFGHEDYGDEKWFFTIAAAASKSFRETENADVEQLRYLSKLIFHARDASYFFL